MRTSNKDYADVIRFLSSSQAFNDGTRQVEIITTHGAKVFLGREHVYKIKLPVNYRYMNFSTLEKRRIACKREFEINEKTAPSIYFGLEPITRQSDGGLKINGSGQIVEWAVHMKRFPEEDVLERMAERGALNNKICVQLGKQIAEYHCELSSVTAEKGMQRVQQIIEGISKNCRAGQFRDFAKLFSKFELAINSLLETHSASLDKRATTGLVRRCHGDLHLRNLVMLDGIPTPFDALEFDEEMATIDVLYDLAFLIMDILHLGLKEEANTVFNRYVLHGWSFFEDDGFAVLPLFLSIRAAIRAMVNVQRVGVDPGSAKKLYVEARGYFDDAIGFLIQDTPKLFAIGGLSGTGKSTLAAMLAPNTGKLPGALLVRSDLERKKMFGIQEFEHLPQEAYSLKASHEVYDRIFRKAEKALAQGQSVILDAVFADEEGRNRAKHLAKTYDVAFSGFWLSAPKQILINRVSKRVSDASDADKKVVEKQLNKYPEFNPQKSPGWHLIDASETPQQTFQNMQLKIQHN